MTSPNIHPDTPGLSARWTIATLALSTLLSSLGVSIPNVALPTLTRAFDVPFQDVQWVIIGYLLAITVMIVSVGRLGDIFGHRRILLAGISLFTLASALCGIAPTLSMLVAARALQGLGAAVLMALTVALVRETVPAERTGSAMGMLGSMSAIGTALGPSLGGILLDGPGWRAIFLIMVPLGLLNFLLARRSLPTQAEPVKSGKHGIDVPGTILLGLTLAAYALSVTLGDGQFGRLNLGLLLAAALGAGLFILVQAKVRFPLIRPAAFRDISLNASLIMNALVATVMLSTLVVGPFYLSRALGLDAAVVGLTMSVGPAISALSGIPAGRIVDRLGAPTIVILGLTQMTLGTAALASLPAFFGIAGYIAAIAILTPGYQLFLAANNTAVMMDVEQSQRGVISGMLTLSRNLGFITGASVMGAVFAFASGTNNVTDAAPEAVSHGMQVTFAVAATLILIALIIAALRVVITREAGTSKAQ